MFFNVRFLVTKYEYVYVFETIIFDYLKTLIWILAISLISSLKVNYELLEF
jgi:hypothetical protein